MPLSRLYPLDVKLAFDDRPYCLGETIHVLVELAPRRDVVVREARLELVCEEDFVLSYSVMTPGRPSISSHRTPGEVFVSPPLLRQRVKKEEREAYVHSSAPLLGNSGNTTLQRDTVFQHTAELFITTQAPPRVSVARIEWRLEGFVDVAMARDVRVRYGVQIELG